jgi:hypothetical protein
LAQRLDGVQLYRLLDAELPTVVVVGAADGAVVVDLVQDQELGPNALVDALTALVAASPVEPTSAPPSPGPLAADEVVRLHLDHRRWLLTTRALGEVAALQTVLTDAQLVGDEAAFLRAARDAARLPERLMAPTLGVFSATDISVRRLEAGLHAQLAARYTEAGRSVSGLRGGAAPVDHAVAAEIGDVALTFALDPAGWARILGGAVRPMPASLSLFLEMASQCGVACIPAFWSAIPGYGVDLAGALASVFPELSPMTAALRTLGGATVVIRGAQGARTFAAALQPVDAGARDTWTPLVKGMRAEWVGVAPDEILVLGTDGAACDALLAARGQRAVAANPVLQVSARRGAGPKMGAMTFEIRFDADAMVLAFTGRPVTP